MLKQQLSLFDLPNGKEVRRISSNDVRPFLLDIHYARRIPSITDAFGLYVNGELVGIVTYGIPASPSLCTGIAGEENQYRVKELNRLVIRPEFNGRNLNYASYLVSHSLKMLDNNTFVVSYADTAWTHVGYIYQACNFLYTGKTKERTDIYTGEGKHSRHYTDEERDSRQRQWRSAKHRYVYLVGDRRTKKRMLNELKYTVFGTYPKGNEVHYDINNPQQVLTGGEMNGVLERTEEES